jgi:hypothetical protein
VDSLANTSWLSVTCSYRKERLLKNLPNFLCLKNFIISCREWIRRFRLKTIVLGYFRDILDKAIRASIAVLLSFLLTWLLFHLVKTFWFVYTSTPVGEQFVSSIPEKADFFNCLSGAASFSLLLHATRETVKICLMTAAGCQILHFARYFYFSRGMVGKALWGVGLAGIGAYLLWSDGSVEIFSAAYAAVILQTLIILPYCFNLAAAALPEIGDLFFSPAARRIRDSLRNWLQDIVFGSKK